MDPTVDAVTSVVDNAIASRPVKLFPKQIPAAVAVEVDQSVKILLGWVYSSIYVRLEKTQPVLA